MKTDGRTGLVLLTPRIDRIVDRWRQRYDPVAAFGMPAHVTVLYPWLPIDEISAADRAALTELCQGRAQIDMTFAGFGRFPQTLWLDPQPSAPIVELVERVAERWPAYPPFGGQFDDIVAHLTLADGHDPEALTDVLADVEAQLPLYESVSTLSLMRFDPDGWVVDSGFAFDRAAR